MENYSDDPKIKELLDSLFLEVPLSVWSGFVDAAMHLEWEIGKQERNFVTPTISDRKINQQKQRGRYKKPIRKKDLAKHTLPARLPKRKFTLKSRNRVRYLLLESVKNMEAREGLTFIWNVINSWLVTASKEYLLCDRTGNDGRDADRLTVVTETLYDIVRSWELNY